MLRVLITSSLKSDPGWARNESPRMLASPSAFGPLASAPLATWVAAAIAAAVAAPAAAAPFRKLRRSTPDSSSGVFGICVVFLRAWVMVSPPTESPVQSILAKPGRLKSGRGVPPDGKPGSVGARQSEHVLGQVTEDEVGRDRRDLVKARLTELALDVVLLGEAEAAVGLQAHVARLPGRLRRELLRHVGFGAAGQALIVERRGAPDHERRGLGRHVGARDRELHALVLADRATEHLALARIGGRLCEEPSRVADALGTDQDAFGVHAVEDVAKALAFLA